MNKLICNICQTLMEVPASTKTFYSTFYSCNHKPYHDSLLKDHPFYLFYNNISRQFETYQLGFPENNIIMLNESCQGNLLIFQITKNQSPNQIMTTRNYPLYSKDPIAEAFNHCAKLLKLKAFS